MSFTRADYPPLSTIAYISTFTSIIFNPTSIAGGVLWLDASLFTQANNTAVTTWPSATASYSLSMTGTGTVNTNVLNGLPVITVSTAQNWSLSAAYTSASYTFFFVSRQTGGTNRRVFIGNGNKLYGYWGGNKNSLYTEGWIVNLNASDTAWDIYTIVRTSSGSGTFSRFGGNLATYASSGAGMDGFYINTGGCCGAETSDAQIAEVLIYNVNLSDADCRKIEGYLAWKWGLQANLTSGHIHASSGPNTFASSTTSTILLNLAGYVQSGANYVLKPQVPLATLGYYTGFNFATLSTLTLWIDGSDPLGTGIAPAQGTLISTLKDKSGNNRAISTFSTTVGFPSYRTAANGALGAIQLAAGNGIFLSSIALTPMMTLYAVYSPILPSTGIAIEQGVNALANTGFLLTSVSTISTIYAIGIPAGIVATGGTVTTAGDFKYHVFTSSGTFTISNSGTVSYLIVGGGGGGGDRHGAGGGAGGVLSSTWAATPGSYTITVGLGGLRGATSEGGQTQSGTPAGAGSKGGNSSISSVATAFGGGGGGTLAGNPTDTSLGSGGGGGGGSFAGIAGTAGQGFAGGSGNNPGGGGGGGAGGAGVNADTGTGGIGTSAYSTQLLAVGYGTSFATSWALGTSTYVVTPSTFLQSPIVGGVAYIGGGGGGASGSSPGPGGSGGSGGGGKGDWDDALLTGGTTNTGGGGGASRSANSTTVGRDGGSGLVLLWYPLTNAPVATGGTVTISGAYKIHTFTTTGNTTFTLTSPASISAQVLVVGGGGAGGSAYVGGGGGAGGAVFNSSFTIASGSYTVTVGAGGVRTTAGVGYVGPSGANSSFSSITGTGGGGGGSYAGVAATNGGCGGGGPFSSGQFGTGSQGGNGAPYGTDGNGGYNCGGGGGGMGGTAPTPSGVRPSGGAGATYTVAGTAYTLAGGGGAGSDGVGGLGQAGGGLGGNGGGGGGATSGTDATANTGSGGGGGGGNNGSLYGGAGGSGIVIIAYLA